MNKQNREISATERLLGLFLQPHHSGWNEGDEIWWWTQSLEIKMDHLRQGSVSHSGSYPTVKYNLAGAGGVIINNWYPRRQKAEVQVRTPRGALVIWYFSHPFFQLPLSWPGFFFFFFFFTRAVKVVNNDLLISRQGRLNNKVMCISSNQRAGLNARRASL